MNNADHIRKTLSIITEAAQPAQQPPAKTKNIPVMLDTMRRQYPSTGRYNFGSSWPAFTDVLSNLSGSTSNYRKSTGRDTTILMDALKGLKKDDRFWDKEQYLRQGYEARGFSGENVILVWFKEKGEHLFIFTKSNDDLLHVREFLRYMGCIK